MARLLLDPLGEAERAASVVGRWIVATVVPQVAWPTKKQIVNYDGVEFILFPEGDNESAGIGVQIDKHSLDDKEARKRIMEFSSALAWAESRGIEIVDWGGGNLPRVMHVMRGRITVDFLPTDHLPNPRGADERAALALYREGISLKNPFYAFLSLYKAISRIIPDGKKRAKWIAQALDDIDDHQAKERLDALSEDGRDVGEYIWQAGRNAIAHAEREPYVNPDELDDYYRLYSDVPLIRNLAELAIEKRGGVRRRFTIMGEHLYELEGFRKIIPDHILEMLKKGQPVPKDTLIEMPDTYTVLARRNAETHAFKNMKLGPLGQIEEGMIVDFISEDDGIAFRVLLHFAGERLVFDPVRGIGFTRDRAKKGRIRSEIKMLQFQRTILGNGHLEVWDSDTQRRLGRSETCVPLNCFVNTEFYEAELRELRQLLDEWDEPN
ncbi:MAG: hypothetical protein OXM59_01085 [Gammaproteobacteria bacterium]|nr:hypothetical protein [Gammaproteobacteria bacterium]